MKIFIIMLFAFISLHATSISVNKASYKAGETMVVTLADVTGNNNNWVGIFEKGVPSTWDNDLQDQWFYFRDGTLKMKTPAISGDYEVRLFYNDSLHMVKNSAFKVVGKPVTLKTDKAQYNNGNTITVSYANISGKQNNWIGLFLKDTPSTWDNDLADKWLDNRNGSVTFTAPEFPGDYEIRLFYNDSLDVAKKTTINVKKIIKPRAPTVYEDAEDGKTLGWMTASGPYTIKNIFKSGSRSIWGEAQWVGDHYPRANKAYYKKVGDDGKVWNNTDQFILELDTIGRTGCMTFGVEVRTKQGFRAITLSTWFALKHYPPQKQVYDGGTYVELTYPMPVALRYGGRHHVRHDLQALLHQLEPQNDIISVDAFVMSGYSNGAGGVDNIRLLSK